ncbi:hypothetical protein [Candidatus Albibeggiatoa sp. nov. NOAA]|uniref:hypothetical protein n=1 Tax=Candidatus Albibeggiatoa sp. nov. NOAA TaxID=3162724 RepID=UPI0032FB1B34|nr:hypothetical protein [Thiotrichaceae bacterium]
MSNLDVSQQPLPPSAKMECGAAIDSSKMEDFVYSFQQSAKRWEIIVYPAMFAFTLLATYGFFLIYSLTSDMTQMATSMDPKMAENMEIMAKNVELMSYNMTVLTQHVSDMNTTMHQLSTKLDVMPEILQHMEQLDNSVAQMNTSVMVMTDNTHRMQVDMMMLSQNISHMMRPMSMFPTMMW